LAPSSKRFAGGLIKRQAANDAAFDAGGGGNKKSGMLRFGQNLASAVPMERG
jgi:hypothetical protein